MSIEELSAAYDAANDAYHDKPSDETLAARQDAAAALVAARAEERVAREAEAASLNDGEARPESVSGSTEVS